MLQSLQRNILLVLLILIFVGCAQKNKSSKEMVYFEGGDITIGSEEGQMNESPVHKVTVEPFYISANLITVADFREFVEATGYVTDAERFGNSGVFDVETGTWSLVEGANWRRPFGQEGKSAEDDHPVTQVSWNDAMAYCEWSGVRLPTEKEWEYAAKSGKDSDHRFSWGDELVSKADYKANVWQGHFPDSVSVEDGYLFTSPVGAYGKTEVGLTDMGGNVWEWTDDTYDLYEGNPYQVSLDKMKKVIRGGSFLCDSTVCFSYRVSARSFNTRESATFHMGFRIAKDTK